MAGVDDDGRFAPISLPDCSSWKPADQEHTPLREDFAKSFGYHGLTVSPNVYLAPMAGVTDPSFRRLCKRLAGGRLGMLVSEFVSIEGLTRFNARTCEQTKFFEEERPFTVQIFGADPDRMAWAARMVEESGADAVEINVGCPVPRVVKRGGGSGLLRQLPLLEKICLAVTAAVKIPVSMKVRIGWSEERITLFETLKIAEGSGIGLLVVHGRTRIQGYKGWANWDLIGETKARASIPVVGNGDVATWQGAVDRLRRYGVDGVLVGRGAMHNPWIFRDVADFYAGKEPQSPTITEQREVFATYLELLREEMPQEGRQLGKLKQFAARSMKAMRGVKEARSAMLRSQSTQEYLDIANTFFDRLEQDKGALDWAPEELENLNGRNETEVECGSQW